MAEGSPAHVTVYNAVFRGLFSAVCAFDHFMFTFLSWFLFRLDYVFFEFAFFCHLVVPAFPAETIVGFVFACMPANSLFFLILRFKNEFLPYGKSI